MGIKATPTCVMNFDGATGWLVGEPNKGMRAMFTMMNEARLGVGMQGLGIAETAYQSAVAYARDRLQGRALTGPKAPTPGRPDHRAPRRPAHAADEKALTEGARALSLWIGMLIDVAHSHRTPTSATQPTIWCADDADHQGLLHRHRLECANLGVQVFGGHGYIRENGMEQFVRDARITQIYEGTNGIQALDLVGRKLPMKRGQAAAAPAGEIAACRGQKGRTTG